MFETPGGLRTWALPAPLPADQNCQQEVLRLADHRPAYLDYEGPVSGERGSVERIESGTFELIAKNDNRWEAELHGTACRGRITLTRLPKEGTEKEGELEPWQLDWLLATG